MKDVLQTMTQFIGTHRSRPRDTCHGPIAEPHRDWHVIFVTFLILLLVFAGLSAVAYLSVEETASGGEQGSVGTLSPGPSASQLSGVLTTYQSQAAQYQALLAHAPAALDPAQ
ncbi:MAG: hypothetical protein KGJ34_01325 [Patescibacteria group bacterium]|nr:hypothetical protein [Patescibacteria group bacterium]